MQKQLIQLALLLTLVMSSCSQAGKKYTANEGWVFGTTYRIVYDHPVDLHNEIQDLFAAFNRSLSTFDSTSTISRINQGEQGVIADPFFTRVFNEGGSITTVTNGAFDMTVAPLVNAWGFGFKKMDAVSDVTIDSLRQYVGMEHVSIENGIVVLHKPGVMLDGSAIAKGYGVDVIASHLKSKGIKNFMVEIGGEISTLGLNAMGHAWRIGVDRPIDDVTAQNRELQLVLGISGKALATSGNYRNFYVKDGKKFAHTIDPRTGYPVEHSLLSASIIASDCITADALATACMVMGLEESMRLIETMPDVEGCFIIQDDQTDSVIWTSGFEQYIVKKE
jgi:FAD:protein FMN transferase